MIDRNPFDGLPASVTSNKDRAFYIDLETFSKVIANAPTARWKALLVLARLGGRSAFPAKLKGSNGNTFYGKRSGLKLLTQARQNSVPSSVYGGFAVVLTVDDAQTGIY
jgi:hypothetical protein